MKLVLAVVPPVAREPVMSELLAQGFLVTALLGAAHSVEEHRATLFIHADDDAVPRVLDLLRSRVGPSGGGAGAFVLAVDGFERL